MTDRDYCPHCDQTVVPNPEDSRSCPVCGGPLTQQPETPPGPAYLREPPPAESGIQILEADDARLMLSIPSGGKRSRSMGCFVVLWNLITMGVTGGFAAAAFQQDGPPWFVFLFLSLFWAVGVGMAVFWVKLRFERGYLFLSADRAVQQKILFGRKRNFETPLDERSEARLAESYQENDEPVYRVELAGVEQTIKFGTGWDGEWKDWYVDTLNAFLDHIYRAHNTDRNARTERLQDGLMRALARCPACGARVTPGDGEADAEPGGRLRCQGCGAVLITDADRISAAIPTDELPPDELPAESELEVSRNPDGSWTLTYPFHADGGRTAGLVLLVIGLIWLTITGGAAFSIVEGLLGRIVSGMMALVFALPGLGLGGLGLLLMWGRCTLTLGPDESNIRWGIGPLSYRRQFATESVLAVKLRAGSLHDSRPKRRIRERDDSPGQRASCMLLAGGKELPVTFGQNVRLSRDAAGVIRFVIRELGYRLQDG